MARRTWTTQQKAEIWRRYRTGESLRSICRTLGHSMERLRILIATTDGRVPIGHRPSGWRLSLAEREEISRGVAAGSSCRTIAKRIRRAPSTVSRKVAANGGRHRYRACQAERDARARARRPKPAKLSCFPRLRRLVEAKLQLRWSPQQIAGWLAEAYPHDRESRESHETIYLSLFVQPRGTLRKQLTR